MAHSSPKRAPGDGAGEVLQIFAELRGGDHDGLQLRGVSGPAGARSRRAGTSVATLRRRLEAEGLPSFRELHDRALRQAACTLLEKRMAPVEVAGQLGFSDLRSFSRAFRRWNGLTPAAFAKRRM